MNFMIGLIILMVIFSFIPTIYKYLKNSSMKWLQPFFFKIKYTQMRFYRILNVKKRSEFVWKDLIKYNQEKGWRFGQYETEKRIETTFINNKDNSVTFNYTVTNDKLEFSTIILNSFYEDKTNDILVLASHFNALLSFGVVRVSVKYNYVEYTYSGDLITYMLYSGEIDTDHKTHYNLSEDCAWAFNYLLESDDDPVFVFSELLKRKEELKKTEE
jgi:hypothetical protein